MKWFKRGILIIALIVLFIISAMIAVVVLVDPNDYKDRISEAVFESTGRNLHIDGDIGLSVFPWLGLELNQVSLDNRPDFTQAVFAEMQRLNIKVALLPLLSLNIKVGEIQLQGLRVNLERRVDGLNNWNDLIAGEDTAGEAAGGSATDDAHQESGQPTVAMREFYIGGIDIEDASISWSDKKANTLTQIEYFNLATNAILPGKPTSFDLRFAYRNETPKLIAGIEMSGDAGFDLVTQRYSLSNLRLNLKASGTVIPGNDQEIDLAVNELVADLDKQTFGVDLLKLATKEIDASIKLDAHNLLTDTLAVNGNIEVRIPSIRTLMNRIGQLAPLTSDEKALGKLEMTSQFKGGLDALEFQNLQMKADDSTLTGSLAVRSFAAPVYRFDLNIDQLDLDRYMPPPLDSEDGGSGAASPINLPVESIEPELPVPVDTLRELHATGKLNVAVVKIMNLHLANIEAGLNAGNSKVALKPLSLELYDGKFTGDILLDLNGNKPVYTTNLNLAAVQSGPLLQDYMGKRLLEGQMNAQGRLDTRGTRISEFEQNLNGVLDLAFKDGALSTDTRQRLRERKAELKQKLTGGQTETGMPVGEPTKFSSITATANIVNGVVSNNDLDVRARHMYVTGKGRFEISRNYIDYAMTVLLSNDGAGQDDPLNELVDFPIEYHLKGKLEELDYAKITRNALANAVKAKLKFGVDKEKQAAKAELEQRKAEFETQKRQAAEKEKAELEQRKKEAEQRAREKLEKNKNKLLDRLLN
jgi:AsmA protein